MESLSRRHWKIWGKLWSNMHCDAAKFLRNPLVILIFTSLNIFIVFDQGSLFPHHPPFKKQLFRFRALKLQNPHSENH